MTSHFYDSNDEITVVICEITVIMELKDRNESSRCYGDQILQIKRFSPDFVTCEHNYPLPPSADNSALTCLHTTLYPAFRKPGENGAGSSRPVPGTPHSIILAPDSLAAAAAGWGKWGHAPTNPNNHRSARPHTLPG